MREMKVTFPGGKRVNAEYKGFVMQAARERLQRRLIFFFGLYRDLCGLIRSRFLSEQEYPFG